MLLTKYISMINNISMIIDKKRNGSVEQEEQERDLIKAILSTFRINGKVVAEKDNWDFVVHTNRGSTHYIEFKKMIPMRNRQILESVAYTQLIGSKGGIYPEKVWTIFLTETLPNATVERIVGFCRQFDIKTNVVFADVKRNLLWIKDGKVVSKEKLKNKLPHLENIKTTLASRPRTGKSLSFSNNQQWIIKHLLLNGIDKKYWGFEQNKRLHVSTELMQVTGIVQSACYNTLKALEAAGYLTVDEEGYRFRNLTGLINAWKVHMKAQKNIEFFAAPYKPGISVESWWNGIQLILRQGPKYLNTNFAIGGSVASSWYGLKILSDFSVVFHLGSTQITALENFLQTFELAKMQDATKIKIVLWKSFKPVVKAIDGRPRGEPYVDIMQVAFDGWSFGVRGLEQSERIFEKVLNPFWARRGWTL